MNRNLSLDSSSAESDVFYVERSSEESSPIRNNTPVFLNSTELSGAMARDTITISSVASPEPQIVAIDSDSNDPTFSYGFGNQHPIMPPSLIDLNLPHNPFNMLATMAVIRQDEDYSPQSPEASDPSPISTPPMNLSSIEGWETTHTTTDDITFYSEAEPRGVNWDIPPNETLHSNEPGQVSSASSPSSTAKKRAEHEDVFSSKKGSVAAHLRGMWLAPTSEKDTLMFRKNSNSNTINQTRI